VSRRRIAHLVAGILVLSAAACSPSAVKVATLRVSPSEFLLPFPGFETLAIELTPRVELPPGSEPRLFLHLIDEPGSVIRTFDLPLAGSWTPGRVNSFAARIHQSALADPLESGTYFLTAGLYDHDGARFALDTEAKEVARLEYAVATVTVPVPGSALPTVRFSESWLPAAPGQDRQILVRRGLDAQGPGTFQIGPLTPPGLLLLRLAPAAGGRIELESGAAAAKVRLRSSCGGYAAELPGDTAVEALVEVPEAAGPVSCDVELAPNFVVRSGEDRRPRSTMIEVLAWRSGAIDGG
jgi:hypothetical protein